MYRTFSCFVFSKVPYFSFKPTVQMDGTVGLNEKQETSVKAKHKYGTSVFNCST